MKKELYIVYRNKVPEMTGTRVECGKFLKALKKQIRANPYYTPNWDNFYCGKLSTAKSYLNKQYVFYFQIMKRRNHNA